MAEANRNGPLPGADDAKVAYTVITGASRGIGFAFAEALAKEGRALILTARDEATLQAKARVLAPHCQVPPLCVAADLSTPQGPVALQRFCEGRRIELLINNAGSGLGQAFVDEDRGAIAEMLRLNVLSLTLLTHALLPALKATRGSIVQVASYAGFQAVPFMAAYAASKAYVLHLAEALAEELAHDGVHVMALCPGAVATDFWPRAFLPLEQTRMRAVTPAEVVQAALAGLRRRQRVVVPGVAQQLSLFGSRFLPRRTVVHVAAKLVNREH